MKDELKPSDEAQAGQTLAPTACSAAFRVDFRQLGSGRWVALGYRKTLAQAETLVGNEKSRDGDALNEYRIMPHTVGLRWSKRPPSEPGLYLMRCDETSRQPSAVTVYLFKGELWADDPDIGKHPLSFYHDGLIGIEWTKPPND